MGEYLSPGLFLSERKASAGPVAAASTSTYATVGWLPQGPVNEPQLVTSFARFVDIFGSYWRNSFIPFMLAGFFQNQGARAYITRVVPSDATKSANTMGFDDSATAAEFIGRPHYGPPDLSTNSYVSIAVDGGSFIDIDCAGSTPSATTPTEIANAIDTALTNATCTLEAPNDKVKITSNTTGETSQIQIRQAPSNDATEFILGLDFDTYADFSLTGKAASDWKLEAKFAGAYYNQIRMCISGNPDYATAVGGYTRYNAFMEGESSLGAGDWETLETYDAVDLDTDTSDFWAPDVINDRTNLALFTEGTGGASAPRTLVPQQQLAEHMDFTAGSSTTRSGTLREAPIVPGTLEIGFNGTLLTDDGDGAIEGTGIDSGTINYTTGAWSLTFPSVPATDKCIIGSYYSEPAATELCAQMTEGTDGSGITRGDVTDPALEAGKEGLYSFNSLDQILNISMPDFAGDVTVTNDLIAYGESKKNRFVICTTPIGTTPQDAVKFVRNTAQYNTSYAALYYPWVKIYDPIANDGRSVTVPPDGFIAGVYARTDTQRNVGKAPAGITDGKLNGIVGLERVLDKGERDILYPARINPLVSSPQTGLAVWGARTLSKDAEWLYVNARRLFMFCEQSIYDASFWVVFENNNPGLWARMKSQGDGFFGNLFRDGYFAGATPDEAFAIVIDDSNNPQSAIDAGIVTADYYISPNKPAEFVRLRFQQKVRQ